MFQTNIKHLKRKAGKCRGSVGSERVRGSMVRKHEEQNIGMPGNCRSSEKGHPEKTKNAICGGIGWKRA